MFARNTGYDEYLFPVGAQGGLHRLAPAYHVVPSRIAIITSIALAFSSTRASLMDACSTVHTDYGSTEDRIASAQHAATVFSKKQLEGMIPMCPSSIAVLSLSSCSNLIVHVVADLIVHVVADILEATVD